MITLGSLFDGAGGFPYAGKLAGFTPRWASEIEPFPIRVTTRRFPRMKHLGNITEINGAEIEPVDVITFGSPCQDLSVANGNRKGLDGERSGLFREAIRIIREMRKATNGEYPKYIVWENVPGAFSSNKGADFREVLQEIAATADETVSIPRPPKGKWTDAGEYVDDNYSIAWRTIDAQYWGVPQRRRRIYLVADFRAERAPQILFERESLYGDITQSGGESERTATDTQSGTTSTDRATESGVTAGFHGHKSITGNICFGEERSPCVETHMPPNVITPAPKVYGLVSKNSNSWKSGNAHSGCYEADTARTLDHKGGDATCNQGGMLVVFPEKARSILARYDSSPCVDRGQNVVVTENYPQDSRIRIDESGTIQTLTNRMGDRRQHTPMILDGQPAYCLDRAMFNQGQNAQYKPQITEEQAQTLVAKGPHAVFTVGNGQVDNLYLDEKARTLNCMHDAQIAVIADEAPDWDYIVRRLTPLECCRLQGYPDWWTKDLELTGISEKYLTRWTKKDQRVPRRIRKQLGKWLVIFETHRRTTSPDIKPKTRKQIATWLTDPYSDSAQYKMWGNSLAIPCAYTVLQGIADALNGKLGEHIQTSDRYEQLTLDNF